jgi:hypothetical protein
MESSLVVTVHLDETFLRLFDRDKRLAKCYVLKFSMKEMSQLRDMNNGRRTSLGIQSPTGFSACPKRSFGQALNSHQKI